MPKRRTGSGRSRRLAAWSALVATVWPSGVAVAGPTFGLPVPLTPTFTSQVTRRFTPCCLARASVTLREAPGTGPRIDWTLRWLARDHTHTAGGEEIRLGLAIPPSCRNPTLHAVEGRRGNRVGRPTARYVALEPGAPVETIDPDAGFPPRWVGPEPIAEAGLRGDATRPGLAGMAMGAGRTRSVGASACRAVVRMVERRDTFRLEVVSSTGNEWATASRSMPRRPQPVVYALYPLSIVGDVVWSAAAIPANAVILTGLAIAAPFVWLDRADRGP